MITMTECLWSFLDLTTIIRKGCIVRKSPVSKSLFNTEPVFCWLPQYFTGNKEAFEKIKTFSL